MQALELLRRQRELDPKQDLHPYQDQWVVLRHGEVQDHALDIADLVQSANFESGDAVLYVKDPSQLS